VLLEGIRLIHDLPLIQLSEVIVKFAQTLCICWQSLLSHEHEEALFEAEGLDLVALELALLVEDVELRIQVRCVVRGGESKLSVSVLE